MSKPVVTVFLCTGKDCNKAWRRFCQNSPGKWLKKQVAHADLPYKLKIVKTECMDKCEQAACLCLVYEQSACPLTDVCTGQDADSVLACMRSRIEDSQVSSEMR